MYEERVDFYSPTHCYIKNTMKDRIQQLMRHEGMTQQEFATTLELSPSSLSSIFNGRTNPTNNHVLAIHKRFPNINVNWLMFGEGDMYVDEECEGGFGEADSGMMNQEGVSTVEPRPRTMEEGGVAASLFAPEQGYMSNPTESSEGVNVAQNANMVIREIVKYTDKPQRKITEIRIFFDDGTFETFQGTR